MKKILLLVLAVILGVGSMAGCSPKPATSAPEQTEPVPVASEPASDGKVYKIGVSLPSPANQWVGAIIDYAKKEAAVDAEHFDVKVVVSDNPAAQVAAIEDLMLQELDAMVVLPLESAPLTPICEKVYDAGIPLLVLDRGIASEKYSSFLAGDNYGIGREAAHYIGKRLKGTGKVVEMMGVPCEIVSQRSNGFNETLKKYYPNIEVVAQANGNFSREPSLKAMEDILQAQPKIDAVYSHDDEQSLGIMVAIQNAGREKEMFVTGAGGNKGVYTEMMNGNPLMGASFTYSPTMGGSAVMIAKKLAMGAGLSETMEKEVPRQIILNATTVTSENVKKFFDENSNY